MMAVDLDTHELAWAAGFFDGEGTFTVRRSSQGYRSPVFSVHQVDPRPLRRFHQAVGGLGNFYGPSPGRGRRSPIYHWATGRFEHIQAAAAMLWLWLSEPKREQLREGLRRYRDLGPARIITVEQIADELKERLTE